MARFKLGLVIQLSLAGLLGLISLFLGYVLYDAFTHKLRPSYLSPTGLNLSHAPSSASDPLPADPSDVFWMVQISDLHISRFQDPRRSSDLSGLCRFLSSSVLPSVVLLSGDLTDAKQPDFYGSTQHLQEWETYKKVLGECRNSLNGTSTHWLDMRGNHDAFDVLENSDEFTNPYLSHAVGVGHSR